MQAAFPFDSMAAEYDDAFTNSAIGRLMRQAVWRRIDARFTPGARVIELGCGTGADAVYMARRGMRVLATDASQGMLAQTRAKIATLSLEERVAVAHWDLNARCTMHDANNNLVATLPWPPAPSPRPLFDGALANFGSLNCVADLGGVAAGLAQLLRPGGVALLCVMGPLAPWEWGWYLARGDLRRAARRLRPGGTPWRGLTIRYPRIGALQRAFQPCFHTLRVSAVGALIPPSYVEPWARRHPYLLWALHRLERAAERLPPLPQLADHYLIELKRTHV